MWYYDQFQFILDVIETRPASESIAFQADKDGSNSGDTIADGQEIFEYLVNHDGSLEEYPHNVSQTTENDNTSCNSSISSAYKDIERPKRIKNSDPADSLAHVASDTFKTINKALETKTANNTKDADDLAFTNFRISKLNKISDKNIRLEVEEEITNYSTVALDGTHNELI